jgi:exonuclease III
MKFKSDFSAVMNSDADILFIQECEKVPRDYFEGFDFHWVGQNESKGLGVLTKGDSKFPQDIYNSKFVYFLPVVFKDTLVLGTWAFNGRAKRFSEDASGYFLEVLEHYGDWMKSSSNVIVAGDFNNGPQWDIAGHPNNFADINAALNELGLISAYHSYYSEKHGQESKHTYYHQRNPEKSYHIDYIYSSFKDITSVNVEPFSDWSQLSDHVPLTAELGN